ncbi:MAG: aromatic amino acid lyase, partial [Candidatus Thalassarchaeaceae archaeon]|nr:aromatic amino acid lyase [Candidatus Thalassarchaeaceae archaeon]
DHVSMGSTASERLIEICNLASCVLANEMIIASSALDFREEKPGVGVVRLHGWVRAVSEPIVCDRSLSDDTMALADKILKEGV